MTNQVKRYWLIEQPDLDDDDDYKIVHTTDLDCYPEAIILGEYVLKPEVPEGFEETIDAIENDGAREILSTGRVGVDHEALKIVMNYANQLLKLSKGGA